MSNITVISVGDGTAYVDNEHPNDGEIFTLYSDPIPMGALDDIQATESHGYYIALPVQSPLPITYQSAWGDVQIVVIFADSPFYALLGFFIKKKRKQL